MTNPSPELDLADRVTCYRHGCLTKLGAAVFAYLGVGLMVGEIYGAILGQLTLLAALVLPVGSVLMFAGCWAMIGYVRNERIEIGAGKIVHWDWRGRQKTLLANDLARVENYQSVGYRVIDRSGKWILIDHTYIDHHRLYVVLMRRVLQNGGSLTGSAMAQLRYSERKL